MREELAVMTYIDGNAALPGIVFGLDPSYNDHVLLPSERGAREGVVWHGAVTLDMIDRRSREAFEAIIDGVR